MQMERVTLIKAVGGTIEMISQNLKYGESKHNGRAVVRNGIVRNRPEILVIPIVVRGDTSGADKVFI